MIKVSCRGFRPESRNGSRAAPGAVLEREWIGGFGGPAVRSFARSSGWACALQLFVPEGRASLAPLVRRYNRRPCPSFPISTSSSTPSMPPLAGRRVAVGPGADAPALRGTPAELTALAGQRVTRVARAGKFLDLDLDRDRVVVNPMLDRPVPARRSRGEGAVRASPSSSPSARARRTTARTRPPGRPAPHGCRTTPHPVLVRYRDPTQMGKVYLLPAGVERPIPGRGPGEMGPDALDPSLTIETWRERIRKHPGRAEEPAPQPGVRGGHRQRVLGRDPVRRAAAAVPQAIVARAGGGRRAVPRDADHPHRRGQACCGSACPPTFEKQVRDQLSTHNRAASPARGAGQGHGRDGRRLPDGLLPRAASAGLSAACR